MTEWVEGEYIEHRGIGGTDLKVRMEGGGGGGRSPPLSSFPFPRRKMCGQFA